MDGWRTLSTRHGLWLMALWCLKWAVIAPGGVAWGDEPSPAFIELEVPPFYVATEGGLVSGPLGVDGLMAPAEDEFLAALEEVREHWSGQPAEVLFIGAIQLYNRGFRHEAVRWFYTAQVRMHWFAAAVEPGQLLRPDSVASVRMDAQEAFFRGASPFINGFALRHPDGLIALLAEIRQAEAGLEAGDHAAPYEGVRFTDRDRWAEIQSGVLDGLDELAGLIRDQREAIAQDREETGAAGQFDTLESRELPRPE